MNVQFNNPGPDTQLIVGTVNTLKILVSGITGTSVSWSVIPVASLAGAKTGTATVQGGQASFSFGIKSRPGTDSQFMVLVSVWDTEAPDAGHCTALYRCARPRMQYSISRTYGETADPQVSPFDPNDPDPDQVMMVTLWLSDADEGTPLNNNKVTWRGHPANPTYVLTADNKDPQLDPADVTGNTFLTYTDPTGRAALKFANTAPSIVLMSATWGGVTTRAFPLTFSALGTPWIDAGVQVPEITDPVNLDDYDDAGVPITINADATLTWMQNGAQIYVGCWLNGIMTDAYKLKVGDTIKIPKRYFMSLEATEKTPNVVAYTVVPAVSANGEDSNYLPVNVLGTVPPAAPQRPSGALKGLPPYLPGKPATVTPDIIAGGLQVFVPQSYTAFQPGDTVVMSLYLNGLFPQTGNPRIVTLSSPEYAIPVDEQWGDFSFVFSENQLSGFDGANATLVAQYEVRRSGVSIWSDTLTVALATAAP
ncbi:hypothetical protein [Bordetella bronchialis]|uniref:Uncharacterized protein n=1 Tax=Bordetella bronchialis TaxID=463025 RepID=A0A193FDB0_9BORD|nr:hypothetical protein [Bordetella bronchialis]ANN65772.1 hypothetical protein BAU06_05215 [Bordetella bronchialis]ANN70802.1 hypothetical protein BAU08_05185 [Bordetella bronchialis]